MRSSNTATCVHAERSSSTSLMNSPQEIQDVKDKLEDLTPWVTKLKDGLVNTAAKGDHKEAERRTQLAKFASHLRSLTTITNLL